MSEAFLEHANITVKDPDKTAQLLVQLFGWNIRWSGEAIHGGYSVHVGGERSYLALYALKSDQRRPVDSYRHLQGLNHLGIVVDDLEGDLEPAELASVRNAQGGGVSSCAPFSLAITEARSTNVVQEGFLLVDGVHQPRFGSVGWQGLEQYRTAETPYTIREATSLGIGA